MDRFNRIVRAGKTALVRNDCLEEVAAALCEGRGCIPWKRAGRGTVFSFPYPGGEGILRQYTRGGLMRALLKNRYFLRNRPWAEFRAHRHLEEHGFPVPPLLGVCWQYRWGFLKGAIATARVPGDGLLDVLETHPEEHEQLLRDFGQAIRGMHALGVWHADLQVHNLMVSDGAPLILDLDAARLRAEVTPLQRARNLLRLRRSIQKNGLDPAVHAEIRQGYGALRIPSWLDWAYRAKARASDTLHPRNRP